MIQQVRYELRRLGVDGSIIAWATGDQVELELYGWDGSRVALDCSRALGTLKAVREGDPAEAVFTALEAAR
jgi:hypothetical protein